MKKWLKLSFNYHQISSDRLCAAMGAARGEPTDVGDAPAPAH